MLPRHITAGAPPSTSTTPQTAPHERLPSQLAHVFAASRTLHEQNNQMYSDACSLVRAGAKAVKKYGAEPNAVHQKSDALISPLSAALAVQEKGDALFKQVNGLLDRQAGGGPKLTPYEKKVFGDRLAHYQQEARQAAGQLAPPHDALWDVLEDLAPKVLQDFSLKRQTTHHRADVLNESPDLDLADFGPDPREASGRAAAVGLKAGTWPQTMALSLYALATLSGPRSSEGSKLPTPSAASIAGIPPGSSAASGETLQSDLPPVPEVAAARLPENVVQAFAAIRERAGLNPDHTAPLLQQDLKAGVRTRTSRQAIPDSGTHIDLRAVPAQQVAAAVQHSQQLAQPAKGTLAFDYLQPILPDATTMAWLEKLSPTERKLWATYAYAEHIADQAFSKASPTPEALWLDRAQTYWRDQQLPEHPYQYEVSFNESVPIGPWRVPVGLQIPLQQACLLAGLPGMDLSKATIRLNDPITQKQSLTPAQQASVRSFLTQAGTWPKRDDILASPASQPERLKQLYADRLTQRFNKDLLEAKAKGHLTGGDAYLNGLAIVMDGQRGDPSVSTGRLQLSTGAAANETVELTNWRVFVRNEPYGSNNGVVLYQPQAEGMAPVFSQHLDLTRLKQQLEVDPALQAQALQLAQPKDRPALTRFFQTIKDRPDFFKAANLTFKPDVGGGFEERTLQWATDRLAADARKLHEQTPAASQRVQLQASALELQYKTFMDELQPDLREFTRRRESDKLTQFMAKQNTTSHPLPVNADDVFIDYNGRKSSWTDWVLEGYRQYGDMPFELDRTRKSATTNNFQQDARITVRNNPTLQALLNQPEIKQSVEMNLRATYAGDDYIAHMKSLLDSKNPRSEAFQKLRVATQALGLRGAVQTANDRGELNASQVRWLTKLIDKLPVVRKNDYQEISELTIGGRRIPGVWVLSQTYAQTNYPNYPDMNMAEKRRESFVYLSGNPGGQSLYRLDENFDKLLKGGPVRDEVERRVRAEDRLVVDRALNSIGTGLFKRSLSPVHDFVGACDQLLRDIIDNTAETTTSKAEVIEREIVKGARYLVGVGCTVATGGVGGAACALGTGVLGAYDIAQVLQLKKRGKDAEALMEAAFLALDALDVVDAVKAARPGVAAATKAAGGGDKALGLLGGGVSEQVEQAMMRLRNQMRASTPEGWLNELPARTDVRLTDLRKSHTPEHKGRFYTRGNDEGLYIIESKRVYEVFTTDELGRVRVRDPQRPAKADSIEVFWRDGHWQVKVGRDLAPTELIVTDSVRYKASELKSAETNLVKAFVESCGFGGGRNNRGACDLIDIVKRCSTKKKTEDFYKSAAFSDVRARLQESLGNQFREDEVKRLLAEYSLRGSNKNATYMSVTNEKLCAYLMYDLKKTSEQKQYMTLAGWRKSFIDEVEKTRPANYWTWRTSAAPRTGGAKPGAYDPVQGAHEQISIYRTMDKAEADAILGVPENKEAGIAAKPGGDIAAISGHLGDLHQAARYFADSSKNDKVILRFTLKPGAHQKLFSPDTLAIMESGEGAGWMHGVIQARFPGKPIQAATGGEGLLPGFIGVKSEALGEGGFSLGMGKAGANQEGKQKFKDLLETVDVVIGPKEYMDRVYTFPSPSTPNL